MVREYASTRVRDLQPAERVAEEVMKVNARFAQEMWETGATFTLNDLDHRIQALPKQLEDTGTCRRDEPLPPIIPKVQWLQAQWDAIHKLARRE
jgi:hypothetical protein